MRPARLALLLLAVGACSEASSPAMGPDSGAAPMAPPAPPAGPPPAAGPSLETLVARTPRRLRRLSNAELEGALNDLLGKPVGLTRGFLPDPRVEGYDTDAIALSVSESKVDEVATAAERAAEYVSAPARIDAFAPCAHGEVLATCGRRFATAFATRAWGRPATDEELGRLDQVLAVGLEEGYPVGVRLLTQAILQSPHFVYRSELGEGAVQPGESTVRLAGHEIASSLSFLLVGTRPDAELREAAARGELVAAEARERHARRLLATAAGRARIRAFLRAWLGLTDVAMINKDIGAHAVFTPSVRYAMDRELDTFLDHVLLQAEGKLDELHLADYTFPGPALAPIYGQDLKGPIGDHVRVPTDPARRRGLLSSPAFLAAHAAINRTNPIDRGLVVRGRIFCQEVAPPPPGVAAEPPGGPRGQTNRQKYAAHSEKPECAACHRLMDPIGFGFEMFDLLGRYQTEEGGQRIDSTGELHGTDVDGKFVGPAQLSERIARSREAQRCFVEQLWRFAEGRALEDADGAEIDAMAAAFEGGGRRIVDLLAAYVKRSSFVTRVALPEVAPAGGQP